MPTRHSMTGTHILSAAETADYISVDCDGDNPIRVLHAEIGQAGQGDEGDAQAEMLGIEIGYYTGAQTQTGGVVATKKALEPGDAETDAIGYIGATTAAATKVPIITSAWNVQAGYLYVPVPEIRFWCPPTGGFYISSPTQPQDTLGLYVTVIFEELMFTTPTP